MKQTISRVTIAHKSMLMQRFQYRTHILDTIMTKYPNTRSVGEVDIGYVGNTDSSNAHAGSGLGGGTTNNHHKNEISYCHARVVASDGVQ